jgi:hypothetical protein
VSLGGRITSTAPCWPRSNREVYHVPDLRLRLGGISAGGFCGCWKPNFAGPSASWPRKSNTTRHACGRLCGSLFAPSPMKSIRICGDPLIEHAEPLITPSRFSHTRVHARSGLLNLVNIHRHSYLLLVCFAVLSCSDERSKNVGSEPVSNYPVELNSTNSKTAQLAGRSDPRTTRVFQLLTNARNLGPITHRDIVLTARSLTNASRIGIMGGKHDDLDWARTTLETFPLALPIDTLDFTEISELLSTNVEAMGQISGIASRGDSTNKLVKVMFLETALVRAVYLWKQNKEPWVVLRSSTGNR